MADETRCIDCGALGEREGHMGCQYPGARLAAQLPSRAPRPAPGSRRGRGRGRRRRAAERNASREEQHGRYLDAGPAAWDDRE